MKFKFNTLEEIPKNLLGFLIDIEDLNNSIYDSYTEDEIKTIILYANTYEKENKEREINQHIPDTDFFGLDSLN